MRVERIVKTRAQRLLTAMQRSWRFSTLARQLAAAATLQLACVGAGYSQGEPPPMDPMGGMNLDRVIRTFVLVDQLEFQANAAERPVNFELLSWIGGDYRRVFIRAQGEQPTTTNGAGELQADLFFGRLISPFWSAVGGARVETRPRAHVPTDAIATGNKRSRVTRGMVAVGLLGLAPGWFEVEPVLFVSDQGDVSVEFESTVDVLLSQRLILQPRFELNAAVQAVPEFGVGAGLNDVEVGARLRYEIRRKFAPYVGVSWRRLTSGSAVMAHIAGDPLNVSTFSAGVRIWR